MEKATRGGFIGGGPGLVRAGRYAGYGTPEDMNEHFLQMRSLSRLRGPNLAFDLPTQIGYDSDNPRAQGEVGKVGVAVDTLMDIINIAEEPAMVFSPWVWKPVLPGIFPNMAAIESP